jgi:hypothetical protein
MTTAIEVGVDEFDGSGVDAGHDRRCATSSLTPIDHLDEWFVNACAVGMVRSRVVERAEMTPNAYEVALQRLPRSRWSTGADASSGA